MNLSNSDSRCYAKGTGTGKGLSQVLDNTEISELLVSIFSRMIDVQKLGIFEMLLLNDSEYFTAPAIAILSCFLTAMSHSSTISCAFPFPSLFHLVQQVSNMKFIQNDM